MAIFTTFLDKLLFKLPTLPRR